MSILRILVSAALVAATSLRAESPAEEKVTQAIKSPDLSIVHLWAPWCSNCQAELKNGGWLKMVKDNAQVKFYFVSVWNDGGDGKSMLSKFQIADQPNVTILADTGAGTSLLASDLAKQLELKTISSKEGQSAGGKVSVSLAKVDSLAAGEAKLGDVDVGIVDLSHIGKTIGARIDGDLGYNFLKY